MFSEMCAAVSPLFFFTRVNKSQRGSEKGGVSALNATSPKGLMFLLKVMRLLNTCNSVNTQKKIMGWIFCHIAEILHLFLPWSMWLLSGK